MQQQEPSGDYGYDLVHDDVRGGRPSGSAPHPERAAPVEPTRSPDQADDLEYDEAHDF